MEKGGRLRATRNVARDICAEINRKINTTMFHTKNLKRGKPYYSTLLRTMVDQSILSKYREKTFLLVLLECS